MTENKNVPVLYIDDNPSSGEAQKMLRGAGFDPKVKKAPSGYRAAYAMPVLFGLFNRFEGIEGIRIFLNNASGLSKP
jgi:RNase H-fold protein (predicted Holliday junction resolvase)